MMKKILDKIESKRNSEKLAWRIPVLLKDIAFVTLDTLRQGAWSCGLMFLRPIEKIFYK